MACNKRAYSRSSAHAYLSLIDAGEPDNTVSFQFNVLLNLFLKEKSKYNKTPNV